MALSAEENAFNDGVDALQVLWEAMVDAMAGDAEVRIVWAASKYGDLAADSTQGADDTLLYDFGRQYYWRNNPNTTNSMPHEIGGRPLFFKITNAAGELL